MPHKNRLSPYRQGFFAPQRGKALNDCPHPVGSEEWRQWCQGWKEVNGCPDDDGEEADHLSAQRSSARGKLAS
jgi:hypothetical protein